MEKKTVTIGTLTFGTLMIAIGIITLIALFTNLAILRYVFIAWPLFLVALGFETLYYNAKKNVEIKWNIISLIVIGFILLISLGVGMIGSLMNIVYKDEKIEERFETKVKEAFCDIADIE